MLDGQHPRLRNQWQAQHVGVVSSRWCTGKTFAYQTEGPGFETARITFYTAFIKGLDGWIHILPLVNVSANDLVQIEQKVQIKEV